MEHSITINTFLTGPGIDCYYCGHEEDDCNADMPGVKVQCQMDDPEGHNYGNVCFVGHSGKSLLIFIDMLVGPLF